MPKIIPVIIGIIVLGLVSYAVIQTKQELPVASNKCIITGCSGQICSDEEVITTCEFRSGYACYKNARCERQANKECGWTETPELITCLAESGVK